MQQKSDCFEYIERAAEQARNSALCGGLSANDVTKPTWVVASTAYV